MPAVTHPLRGAKSKRTQRLEELNNNLGFIVNLSEIKPCVDVVLVPTLLLARGEEAGLEGIDTSPDGGIDE